MTDTIVAISTARSPAGIGIVRLSGEKALDLADQLFESSQSLLDPSNDRKLLYGHMKYKGQIIDEVLTVAFYGPNSYTREDMVEVQCHGGPIVLDRILEAFLQIGAQLAQAGEFTRRAFLNGRMDLTQAEAVMDIIEAETMEAQKQGIGQLKGDLSSKVEEYRQKVVHMLALIVANIDFPTDEVEDANYTRLIEQGQSLLDDLIRLGNTFQRGKILRDGVDTVIVGKPNVGKSSLLNRLLRENRAIVTDIPGTTRDVIEERIRLDGISLRIKDTAGIRKTEDVVEKIGIEKALESIEDAQLILAVLDSSKPLDQEDRDLLEKIQSKKYILLLNKQDLDPIMKKEDLLGDFKEENILEVSLIEDLSTLELEERIKSLFLEGNISSNEETIIHSIRHKNLLDKAISSLESALEELKRQTPLDCIEVDLQDVNRNLGLITGMTVEEEILDTIFSKFCIGK